MQKNILLSSVVLFFIACGAQNSPNENRADTASATPEISDFSNGSQIILPKTIAIDFPKELNSSTNSSFNKKVSRVQKVIDTQKFHLELLKLAIDDIENACPEENTTCHFEKGHFRVDFNHQTMLLGEIELKKYELNSSKKYDLQVFLNNDISIKYEFRADKNDTLTTYLDTNSKVKLHYLSQNKSSKALYIDDRFKDEKSTFTINLETNESYLYVLNSNHIKNGTQEFSSSLYLEEPTLLTENIRFFNFINNARAFSADRLALLEEIKSQDLKDGNYLLFSPTVKVMRLNLIEQLKLSVGRFTYYKGEMFGLVVDDNEHLAELQIVSLDY